MDQTITRIAEQLGFAAERIWPQVVMVTWVTSLFWAIVDPLIVLLGVVAIIRLWRFAWVCIDTANKEYAAATAAESTKQGFSARLVSHSDYDPTWPVVISVLAGIAVSLIAIIALASFPDALAGALYPEATTVMRIAKGLK